MYRKARYAAEQLLDDPVAVAQNEGSQADAMARSEYLEQLEYQQGIMNMSRAKQELDALKATQASLNESKFDLVNAGKSFMASTGNSVSGSGSFRDDRPTRKKSKHKVVNVDFFKVNFESIKGPGKNIRKDNTLFEVKDSGGKPCK